MLFRKTNLQKTKKIGDILAVQVWMDYAPERLPEYWREALVSRGVGALKQDGTVRLTRRGRRLRAELRATPDDSALRDHANRPAPDDRARGAGETRAGQEDIPARGVAGRPAAEPASPMPAGWGRRPWREVLARCTEELAHIPSAPRIGSGPRRSES